MNLKYPGMVLPLTMSNSGKTVKYMSGAKVEQKLSVGGCDLTPKEYSQPQTSTALPPTIVSLPITTVSLPMTTVSLSDDTGVPMTTIVVSVVAKESGDSCQKWIQNRRD